MICFIIAMDKEAAPVISAMKAVKEQVICGKRVICGTLYGKDAAVIICGVGKANAACGTQLAADKFNPEEIINLGVAGGLSHELNVGGIYEISSVVQYDFDLTQLNGTAIGTLDECAENYLPLQICGVYPAKKLATGDRFNDSKKDFELLTTVLNADIRDMECGAVAQVCMHAKIPCRSFKIISDLAGSGSTTEQYLKNLSLCFKTLESELKNIVETLNG